MIRLKMSILLALCAATTACGHSDSEFQHLSVLDDTHVAVHAPGRADVIVSASGTLSIAGTPVTINAAQAQIAARYFANAVALRNDAIKTGAAGASTAATAIASVAVGLASGDPDSIDAKVNASAAKVEGAANRVCADVQALTQAQDDLAAALPQFKPYATIAAHEVNDCR
jgi:autotransporter translocation and assembly factor TamB